LELLAKIDKIDIMVIAVILFFAFLLL